MYLQVKEAMVVVGEVEEVTTVCTLFVYFLGST